VASRCLSFAPIAYCARKRASCPKCSLYPLGNVYLSTPSYPALDHMQFIGLSEPRSRGPLHRLAVLVSFVVLFALLKDGPPSIRGAYVISARRRSFNGLDTFHFSTFTTCRICTSGSTALPY
jgi:hypothetical protein